MLLVFGTGPEILADDPIIVHHMAQGLYHPDGLALCFRVPCGQSKSHSTFITLAETSQELRKILVAYRFPTYRSRWRPISLELTNGWLGMWVRMRPGQRPADYIHPHPLQKRRSRSTY